MGNVRITTKDYIFRKPRVLAEQEFYLLRQAYAKNPNYDPRPKHSFWKEFPFVVWFSLGIIIGLPLAISNEIFSFIPGLSIPGLILSFIFHGGSMMNFNDFLKKKNAYYDKLKYLVINSNSYSEFLVKSIDKL